MVVLEMRKLREHRKCQDRDEAAFNLYGEVQQHVSKLYSDVRIIFVQSVWYFQETQE